MDQTGTLPVIGVDGGATTCRFAYRDGARTVELETQGLNATSDRDGAIAGLQKGLAQLAQKARIEADALAATPAYIGLAGLKDAGDDIAAALPLRHVTLAEDRLPAVIGALGNTPGGVAAIGTGSFLACQDTQGVRFAGGWGLVLGDEASGAWLGREILATALRAEDGLTPHTDLTRQAIVALGTPMDVVAFARTATPTEFGDKSRVRAVITAAAAGDPVAIAILRRGADYITDGLAALGHAADGPLCLMGSVAPHYAPYLSADTTIVAPKGTALDGTLALAARMGRDAADPQRSA